MARKKVKHVWIANDSLRRATYTKRKKSLLKKMSELSTLCGVVVCAIVHSPCDPQPEVWPSPPEAQDILTRFKNIPEAEKNKKMMNQEGFLRQMIVKLKEQVKKQQKENREYETSELIKQMSLGGKGLVGVEMGKLRDLEWWIEEKKKLIEERIEVVRKESKEMEDKRRAEEENMAQAVEALRRQPWFMEVMNPYEYMGVGMNEMVIPYGDNISWYSGDLFP